MAFIGEIPSLSGSTTMKQMAMDFAAPFIPDEIMYNILKRLPAKSLKRFQCVCVDWKNLFNKPFFMADHFRHSSHHNPSFLFFQTYGLDPLQLSHLDCKMQVRDLQNAPQFQSLRPRLVSIIGSSNGCLCVSIRKTEFARYPSSVLLWNPATRDVKEVPRFRRIHSGLLNYVLGFGYNSFVNDYKIVAIAKINNGMEVGVYSLSTDSWKEIKFENFLEHLTFVGETVVSSNRSIFWKALKAANKQEEEVIVSFDTATEVFSLIPWPGVRKQEKEVRFLFETRPWHTVEAPEAFKTLFSLTVYKDKLAILLRGSDGSPYINLWVMDDDIGSPRERWSWTMKFTGGHYRWALYCGGAVWRNEIVMSHKRGLCLVNITTNKLRMIDIHGYTPCTFLNYVESLVPIVNIKELRF